MKRFLLAPLLLLSLSMARAENSRPNILFCIADDWGWPHAGAYGDPVVQTPTFDRLAAEGVLFHEAYISSPSCTPSRNAILTGQWHWRLGEGASLYGSLNQDLSVYPHLLQDAGYHIGSWRKSYGPGKLTGKWAENHPAGKAYRKGFAEFLAARPQGAPFCFWLGASGRKRRSPAPGMPTPTTVPPRPTSLKTKTRTRRIAWLTICVSPSVRRRSCTI